MSEELREKSGRSRGSLKLLASTIAIGIGLGVLGALLRPTPTSVSGEGAIVFEGEGQDIGMSKDELRRRLLDRLIRHAARGDDIRRSPDFLTFQHAYLQVEGHRASILERLSAEDSPPELRLAFASALPSRPRDARKAAFESLILPLLSSENTEIVLAAALALDRADLLDAKTSTSCRCRFAQSRLLTSTGAGWWLAWTLDKKARLSWSPAALPGEIEGWSLGLQSSRQDAGSNILVKKVTEPLKVGGTLAANGLPGAHLVVSGSH